MTAAKIIYGTAWKKERTAALVMQAVLHGFTAVDTACQPKHYREDLVGEALGTLQEKHGIKREDLFIQTKFTSVDGQDRAKPLPYDPSTPVSVQVQASFHTSLKNLRTTYLDSLLLHGPLPTLAGTFEAWRAFGSLQEAGHVRLIGVCNVYDVRILRTLMKERKVQIVQNRWYEGNGWDREVFIYCRDHDIQYQSFWTLTGSPNLLKAPELRFIANAVGCTPAQALYRIAQEMGVVPLSGTTNEKHMDDDVVVERIRFEDDVQKELREVKKFISGH